MKGQVESRSSCLRGVCDSLGGLLDEESEVGRSYFIQPPKACDCSDLHLLTEPPRFLKVLQSQGCNIYTESALPLDNAGFFFLSLSLSLFVYNKFSSFYALIIVLFFSYRNRIEYCIYMIRAIIFTSDLYFSEQNLSRASRSSSPSCSACYSSFCLVQSLKVGMES